MNKTKYILHGGGTGNKTKNNEKFFLEITKNLLENATILCIYFSRPEEMWNELFKQDKARLSLTSSSKSFRYEIANTEIDTTTEQIKNADAIYIRGGDTEKLQKKMSEIKDLSILLKNKIVAGSSAGVYILSTYYYTNSQDTIKGGLKILPIKTFCHYTKDKSNQLDELKKIGENMTIYNIPEEKFVIITQ